jgi:hypothetical protein
MKKFQRKSFYVPVVLLDPVNEFINSESVSNNPIDRKHKEKIIEGP